MPTTASVLLNRLVARTRLRHLQVLVQVADLGSLRSAAQAVGLTQPAVTHIVADLEKLLEVELFHRHARGVRPSAAALELVPEVRRMLAALGHGAEAMAARLADGGGSVRLAASAGAISGLLSSRLPTFTAAHPGVQVHVLAAEADAYPGMLARAEVDMVACRRPTVMPAGWQFTPLCADAYVAACGPQHPLATRKRVRWASLGQETWLVSPVETAARQKLEALAQAEGWDLRLAPVVTRVSAMTWAMLAAQPVLTFVPHSVVRQLAAIGQVVVVPLDRQWPMDELGLLSREEPSHGAEQRLREHLCQDPLGPA